MTGRRSRGGDGARRADGTRQLGEGIGERGSGTVLMLGLVAVTLVLFAGIALLARAQLARGTAQSAADLGALAAAEQLAATARSGSAGEAGERDAACGTAKEVVAANGASLTGCALLGAGVVRVTTARDGGAGVAKASARAGPAAADG